MMNTFQKSALRLALLATAVVTGFGLAGCEAEGKVGEASTFDVMQAAPEDIAAALERDGRVVLRGGVLFDTGSARLSPTGLDATSRLAAALERNPEMKLAVVGHTDNVGDFNYNLGLSRQRAESMTDALVREHGVAQDRVAPVGVGPLAPVMSNDTEEGRAQNRRVEVVVIN